MLEFLFAVLLATADITHAQSGSTYKAAVVEFSVNQSSSQRVEINLNGFKDVLNEITDRGGAQIVVFPEDGILGIEYKNQFFHTWSRFLKYPNRTIRSIPVPSQNFLIVQFCVILVALLAKSRLFW